MDVSNQRRSDVKAVLLKDWDPVGIADVPQASDEYDVYVAPILDVLASGGSQEDLARHLLMIETEKMGLPGDPQRARRVAEKLHALKGRGAAVG